MSDWTYQNLLVNRPEGMSKSEWTEQIIRLGLEAYYGIQRVAK